MIKKIKFCGFKNFKSTKFNFFLNIKKIGYVFYSKSKKKIEKKEEMKKIKEFTIKKFIKIGVYVRQNINYIKKSLKLMKINIFQFHGNENIKEIKEITKMIKKPFYITFFLTNNIEENFEINKKIKKYNNVFLTDTYKNTFGGNNKKNNILSKKKNNIVAGGINLKEVKFYKKFFMLDISSGIEINKKKNFLLMKKIKNVINE